MAKTRSKPGYNPFSELEEVRSSKLEHPDVQSPEYSRTQAPRAVAKSQDPKFVKLTAYVPKELHRAAKVRLIQHGREMSDLVEELVSDWLKRQSAGESQPTPTSS